MQFNIYPFELKHRRFPTKKGVLLESSEGVWSEVSPLEGRNQETLDAAIEQLKAIQQGRQEVNDSLFSSVAFGIYGLTAPSIASISCALLLCGTPEEVLALARKPHGCTTAKLKVGSWSVHQAIEVIQELSSLFHLRIDFNYAWTPSDVHQLCSHLSPDKIEFLEDPGCLVDSFAIAYDAISHPSCMNVWKPMACGLPKHNQRIILSSSLESSIGLRNIASLTQSHQIPSHILGLGTAAYIENDLVSNPAFLKDGRLHFPSTWEVEC